MKIKSALAVSCLILLALVTRATAQTKRYVCGPCGLPCDSAVYDKPGACPKCGMPLIAEDEAKAQAAAKKHVGILIFNGVQIIDYTGPYEIFQSAGFEVYTVAETKEPIVTVAGMTVIPKYAFADAPQPDILVVPGGGVAGALGSATTLKWVKDTTAKTEHTMSVCNGAFILAKAGLLDGLTATTTHGNVPRMRTEFPKTKVVDDRRFVDNGKIITTGGLTAGIDGALHVVSLTLGKGTAQQVALGEEYDWRADGGFVRGNLADTQLAPWIDSSLDAVGKWDLVSTEGTTDRWEVVATGTSKLSAAELTDHFGKVCTAEAKWTSVPGTAGRWTFTGRDGKPWSGTLNVQALAGDGGKYSVKLAIAREG
jgi:putative intracellular protease/amidase/DNA-directed RNA polymerase subunit RPC12/RpoP